MVTSVSGTVVRWWASPARVSVSTVYSRADWLSEQGRAFRELWDEATQGHTGQDVINAYRRAIEARRRRARRRGATFA
jgi:hypothetical protein